MDYPYKFHCTICNQTLTYSWQHCEVCNKCYLPLETFHCERCSKCQKKKIFIIIV